MAELLVDISTDSTDTEPVTDDFDYAMVIRRAVWSLSVPLGILQNNLNFKVAAEAALTNVFYEHLTGLTALERLEYCSVQGSDIFGSEAKEWLKAIHRRLAWKPKTKEGWCSTITRDLPLTMHNTRVNAFPNIRERARLTRAWIASKRDSEQKYFCKLSSVGILCKQCEVVAFSGHFFIVSSV